MSSGVLTSSPRRILGNIKGHPSWFMLIAAIGYSFLPLAVVLFGGEDAPFLFNAGWRAGIAVIYALFLAGYSVRHRDMFFNSAVWKRIGRNMVSWKILIIMVAYFDIALFAMSIKHIGVVVPTIMMQLSVFVSVIFVWFSSGGKDDGDKKGPEKRPSTIFFMAVGATGVAFVILSLDLGSVGADDIRLAYLGLLLAAGSAIISGLNSLNKNWGEDLAGDLTDKNLVESTKDNIEPVKLLGATAAGLIASIGVIIIQLSIGLADVGTIASGVERINPNLFIIIAGVACSHGIAGLFWRKADSQSLGLETRAILNIQPILSLLGLMLLSIAAVRAFVIDLPFIAVSKEDLEIAWNRVDLLIMGTAAVLSASILVGFEAENRRWGFKALILSLGSCGAFVYLRDEIYEILGKRGILPAGDEVWVVGGYFSWVGLSATIFTLLLAFRVASLVSRTSAEEAQAFSVFRKLELLHRREVVKDEEVLKYVNAVESSRNQRDLKNAYEEVRSRISQIDQTDLTDVADRQMLNSAEAELDDLVRSKQLGMVLGEVFALLIFAGMTISVALLFRPNEAQAFTRFFVDIFAMIIAAVVMFLTINVRDMRDQRIDEQLEHDGSDWKVSFHETGQRTDHLLLSIVVGITILLTYSALLADKHLDWSAHLGWFG